MGLVSPRIGVIRLIDLKHPETAEATGNGYSVLESFLDRRCYCIVINVGEFPIGMLVGMLRRSDEAFFFNYTDAEIADALATVRENYLD